MSEQQDWYYVFTLQGDLENPDETRLVGPFEDRDGADEYIDDRNAMTDTDETNIVVQLDDSDDVLAALKKKAKKAKKKAKKEAKHQKSVKETIDENDESKDGKKDKGKKKDKVAAQEQAAEQEGNGGKNGQGQEGQGPARRRGHVGGRCLRRCRPLYGGGGALHGGPAGAARSRG